MMHDLEAEKRLALTLVLDPNAWDYCSDIVRAPMFGSDQARAVYEGVKAVVTASKPITPVTVQAAMTAAGRGGSVVPGWAKGTPLSPVEAVELAKRIRLLWEGREIAARGAVAVGLAEKDPAASQRALAELLGDVQARGDGGAKKIDALVYEWMIELERDAKDPNARSVFYDTGFASLDKATGGLARGELSVFAARPGSGKSSFVIALAVNLAARGIPVGMFWLEDDWRDAVRRFLARRFECEAWRLRGQQPAKALNYAASIPGVIERSNLPLFVDDTHGLTITDIQARMRRMSRESGIRVFILDHLGEVRIEREERWGDRHDLAIGRIAREYRDTAKQLQAVPILISQMNRRWEQRGADALPQMSDLDGSGQVEQAARLIAFVQLYRDDTGAPTGKGALHVAKATGGTTGSVGLRWVGQSMTWQEE
jgi:replicative DNA helicase